MGGVPWSTEEIAFLREHSPRMMHQEMATALQGRTATAVRRKCMELGIVRGYWHLPPYQELPKIPMLDAAYLAGHFDGEGCIYMQRSGTSYKVKCTVTAAWLPVLEKYQGYFHGALYPTTTGVNKPLYRWILSGYSANFFFLETLSPYLSEKALQANLALDFIRLRITASHAYPGEDIKQKAFQCYQALRIAKKSLVVFPVVRGSTPSGVGSPQGF